VLIKFTHHQLAQAIYAAGVAEAMEAAKDKARDKIVRIQLGGPTPADPLADAAKTFMDVTVPAATIRAQINERLLAAHNTLAELGIELVPGAPEIGNSEATSTFPQNGG
jgi:hypothetical protein